MSEEHVEDHEQEIINDGDLRKYRHEIPNMADDELGVYEYRLYGHYVRVGHCYESVRTTAARSKMSVGQVVAIRDWLSENGWIELRELAGGRYSIRIIDRWAENFTRYAGVHGVNVHGVNSRKRSPHEPKNLPLDKSSKKTPAGANDGPRPKKSRLDANGIPINNQHPRWEPLWNAVVALARTIGENVDDPSVKGQISNVVAKLIAKPDLVMPADVARFHAWTVAQGWGIYTLGAVPKWIHRAVNGKSEPAAKYHKKANLEDA